MRLLYTLTPVVTIFAVISHASSTPYEVKLSNTATSDLVDSIDATQNDLRVKPYLRIYTSSGEESSKGERGFWFQDALKRIMQDEQVNTAKDLFRDKASFGAFYKSGISPEHLREALKLEFKTRLAYGFYTWDDFLATTEYKTWLAYEKYWEQKVSGYFFGPKNN